MRLIRTSLLITIVFAGSTILAQAQSPKVNENMIVTTDWLAKHLNDESLVLLQVGEKDEYTAAHIPRAQFIQIADISTPPGQGLTLELPPVDELKATFEKFGVSDNSRIVIYFGKDWVKQTTRVFLTLDYLGFGDRTSILDGGFPAWRAEGKPVTSEIVEPKKGSLTPHPNNKLIVDATWVKDNLSNANVRILDARAPQFYSGAERGQMPRAGHIPKAHNIPFSSLVEDANNKFKSVGALRELFDQADVKPKATVATYCHIGQQATLLYFVARYLGYDAHVYDGSFEDWSRRTELPVEKSEP
ncbi:MAG TPA: sulfurtransferase [Pyrinomonadaceae bacterium]|nr:sulfurtransferase [Pyrinomonadaceae bacterium]